MQTIYWIPIRILQLVNSSLLRGSMVRITSKKKRQLPIILFFIMGTLVLMGILGYIAYQKYYSPVLRTKQLIAFLRKPGNYPEWTVKSGTQCNDSVFLMPTSGYIGYLWDDSFKVGNRHQGIDIFAGTEVGETPIFAASDGYLTRHEDWKSSVIIRIPEDPLHPDHQIWTYYTHMADAAGTSLISVEFPAGSYEIPIAAGTIIGYQGNYSGNVGYPVGVHLHFSIVKDDGNGKFLNELKIINTLDPSPYFNLALNAKENSDEIVICQP